ncbi:succinate dehydrogenase cytochrome b subunit [Flavisolibacter ginsenosidimutans]|uniref:Succinate dehydrogenase cytochrome b subunit n=1 Tax=Flavisolibacter ginsenosidimutans TaxID=661481 RepID=A0A5B8UDZ6_9BACT|nr:succinate dehydrogenase cytochrome b subunit [Flavisolibacter ginsenosidimutans]QEC54642.1 succinate dehydrogenase cytochrome b subunit [Flavisolibacter ginsenosidimutans]
MKWSHFFTSAVGRKIVMALTGIFLITFLIVHVGLNACIFADWVDTSDNGEMFNKAAHFMGSTIVTRILEIVLFLGFIVHIVQGYAVEAKNRARRGQGYQVSLGNRGSTWMSRSMALLGTLIFLYLIMHVAQFWVPSRITKTLEEVSYDGGRTQMHNLFLRMYEVFQQPVVVVLYLVGVLALGFHLWHGFTSSFRSIGVHNKKYLSLLKGLGYGFTVIVCIMFALMPISMYLNWVNPS